MNQLEQSDSVTSSSAALKARSNSSRVLALAARIAVLIFDHINSMGEQAGVWRQPDGRGPAHFGHLFDAAGVGRFLFTRETYLDGALYDDFFLNSPFVSAVVTVAAARDLQTRIHPLTYTAPVSKAGYPEDAPSRPSSSCGSIVPRPYEPQFFTYLALPCIMLPGTVGEFISAA